MAVLRLFAAARTAAGTGRDRVPGATVADVLTTAAQRYGREFERVLPSCQVWLNGEPASPATSVLDDDEIGILPPVSGGMA
ncbi:MAG: hypothetical protein JWN46_3983 [Acidimicrobiales bacterium]|nr:hypothetical protein [Acidimicrobiales bacterium]